MSVPSEKPELAKDPTENSKIICLKINKLIRRHDFKALRQKAFFSALHCQQFFPFDWSYPKFHRVFDNRQI